MAGGNNLRKFVQNTLPGMIRGMVAKGGVSSYNTDKGNGMWMRNGKLGADAWHKSDNRHRTGSLQCTILYWAGCTIKSCRL